MQLRQTLRLKRQSLSEETRNAEAKMLYENFLQQSKLTSCEKVAIYLPFDGEMDTDLIVQWLWKNNRKVYLPKLHHENTLVFSSYTKDSLLKTNRYNILESVGKEIDIENLDLIFMPLVAFDTQCHRLGVGKGFYDATLRNIKKRPLLVGLAYDFQRVEKIIPHEFDVKLDAILTPSICIVAPNSI